MRDRSKEGRSRLTSDREDTLLFREARADRLIRQDLILATRCHISPRTVLSRLSDPELNCVSGDPLLLPFQSAHSAAKLAWYQER